MLTGKFERFVIMVHISDMITFTKGPSEQKISYLGVSIFRFYCRAGSSISIYLPIGSTSVY